MSDLLFSFQDATVGHHSAILLQNISLSLRRGDFLGIIGPNGAGKSSLLMALMGLRNLIGGAAEVLGRDVRHLEKKSWASLRKRIGYLPQRPQVDPYFPVTAEEVVLMGRVGHAGLFHTLSDTDRLLADTCMQALGLHALRSRPFGQLSGGEQQKVHLARILAQDPDMILLDEPMSGLDLKWQQRLGEQIEDIAREKGVGIVMVTHEMQHLPPICNRLALLSKGRILAWGDRNAVVSEELLSELYDCRLRRIVEDGRTYLSPWVQ